MKLSDMHSRIVIVVVVLASIGLGYFLWTRSTVPEPTVPPGQSLRNPLGPQGKIVLPSRQAPAGRGTTGGFAVPAPGTVDPRLGVGPSQGARGRMPGMAGSAPR